MAYSRILVGCRDLAKGVRGRDLRAAKEWGSRWKEIFEQ